MLCLYNCQVYDVLWSVYDAVDTFIQYIYAKWQRAEKRGLTLTHTHFGSENPCIYVVFGTVCCIPIRNEEYTMCIWILNYRWSCEISQLQRIVSVSLAAAKGSTYPKVHFMFKFAVTAIQIYQIPILARQMCVHCALGLYMPSAFFVSSNVYVGYNVKFSINNQTKHHKLHSIWL